MANSFDSYGEICKVVASLIVTMNEKLHDRGIAEDTLRAVIVGNGIKEIDKCIDYFIDQGIFERVYLPVFKPGRNWERVEGLLKERKAGGLYATKGR